MASFFSARAAQNLPLICGNEMQPARDQMPGKCCCVVQVSEVKKKLATAEKDLEAARAQLSKQEASSQEAAQLKADLQSLQVAFAAVESPQLLCSSGTQQCPA